MQPIIDIQSLSFSYPDGKQALCDVNLQVFPGEKVALIGPNGAGKSTLLMHLNGIYQGNGRITVAGMEVVKVNLGAVRALVGVVFQNPDDMLFSPTVYEDVAYGPLYQGLDQAAVEERVAEALSAVHMEAYRQRNPYHLSAGEKKKISLAAVLSMRPQVLVFDEPSAGLDPRARRELIDLLASLPQTMLVATHDLPLAARLTPRTVILNAGRVAADGRDGADPGGRGSAGGQRAGISGDIKTALPFRRAVRAPAGEPCRASAGKHPGFTFRQAVETPGQVAGCGWSSPFLPACRPGEYSG